MTDEQKTEAPDHICVEPNYNAFGDPSWGAYLHENVGVAYTRTALSQAAVGAVVRACAEAIDDPDFTQEDVNYVDNGHKWVLLEEAQTAILALIDQPSALDEMLAEKDAEIELTIAVAKVMEENARLRCAIENYRRAQFDVKGEDQEARKRAARTALFAALEGK